MMGLGSLELVLVPPPPTRPPTTTMRRWSKKAAICKARRGFASEHDHAGTLIWDFQLPRGSR